MQLPLTVVVASEIVVWLVIRATQAHQGKVICESVDEAVQMLLIEVVDWNDLLDKPFDQLSEQEWLLVMESEPIP
jgi:hypothetical protein